MRRLVLLIVLTVLFPFSVSFSQSGGLNFMLGFPQGDFKQNVDRTGFGGSLQFMFWDVSPGMPVSLGLNMGYLNYGSENRREPFSLTIPDVTVDVNRTNNLVNFHLLLQIMPALGAVRPYIEGLGGGSYIFTTTEIKSQGLSNQQVASSTNFDDWAWSYGGGAGLMIKLHESDEVEAKDSEAKDGEPKIGSVWLDLKSRYLFGTEASYLKEGSVIIDNGKVTYAPSRSTTDLLTFQIGVVLYFR